jgi:hypothetical protein
VYKGETLSLRQAAKKLGIIDSSVTARSKKLGVSVQEAFDWWVNKTPEERERERVLGSKGIDWRGERLLKSDICDRHGLNYWTVHSRGKRNGLEWVEAAEQIVAERESAAL